MRQQLLQQLSLLSGPILRGYQEGVLDGLSFWLGPVQITVCCEEQKYLAEVERHLARLFETEGETPQEVLSQLHTYLQTTPDLDDE